MWLLLFLTSSSLGIWLVAESCIEYLNYDVVTSIKVIDEIPTEFPTVTFFILRNKTANIPFENLILTCQYNKFECKDISINKDEFGFISYTFKSQLAYQRGIQFGLEIGLNLTSISFNSTFNYKDGVRIIIHNQTLDPNYYLGYSDNGLNLAPVLIYEIPVNRIFSYKLGYPYNNCLKDVKSIDSFDSDLYRFMIKSTNYSFRYTDCLMYCFGRELNKYLNIKDQKLDRWENIVQKHSILLERVGEIYQSSIKKNYIFVSSFSLFNEFSE